MEKEYWNQVCLWLQKISLIPYPEQVEETNDQDDYDDYGFTPKKSKGFLSNLKDKLGIAPPSRVFRSARDHKKHKEGDKT